ncbi:MAG: hypothetical protein ACC608_06185 [Anaerofustis sp.]
MKNHYNAKLWGFVLILIGIGLAGQMFGVWDMHLFRGWWTLFIIVPCLISMIEKGVQPGNIVGLVVGGALLLTTQDILGWDMIGKMVFPAILVAAGIALLVQYSRQPIKTDSSESSDFSRTDSLGEEASDLGVHHSVFFSERTVIYPDKEYTGASLSVSFGKITFDLTHALFVSDREVYVNALFGNVLLIVPAGVNVASSSSPMFGSIKNQTAYRQGVPTLHIDASCIFANVTVQQI